MYIPTKKSSFQRIEDFDWSLFKVFFCLIDKIFDGWNTWCIYARESCQRIYIHLSGSCNKFIVFLKKKNYRHLFKYFLCNLIYSLWQHYASKIASHPFSALSPFLSYLGIFKEKKNINSFLHTLCTPCTLDYVTTSLLSPNFMNY